MPARIPADISTFLRARHPLKVLAACTMLAVAGPVAVAQAAASSSNSGSTIHFPGLPQVGALFGSADYTGSSASHFCTGTVIDSPGGDLVLTAAHCVWDVSAGAPTSSSITFAPGYDNGLNTRFGGAWTVEQVEVPPGYQANGDPADDYALLTIAPQQGLNIEQVTGGLRLGHDPAARAGRRRRLQRPRLRRGRQRADHLPRHRLRGDRRRRALVPLQLPNYQDGTSGGPWITHGGRGGRRHRRLRTGRRLPELVVLHDLQPGDARLLQSVAANN